MMTQRQVCTARGLVKRAFRSTSPSGNLIVLLYFFNKLVPAIISGGAIYLGYRLFISGVTGQASLVVGAHSIGGQLLNAAPGLFFAVGGIVALITSVWKGSSFTFAREDPHESYAFCLPETKRWMKTVTKPVPTEGPAQETAREHL